MLRSLLRSVITRASRELEHIPGVEKVRAGIDDLMQRRVPMPLDLLRREILGIRGLESLLVEACDEGLRIDASFENADALQAYLHVDHVFFAVRGGKEITFRLEPVEAMKHPRADALFIAIASAFARVLWSAMLPLPESRSHEGYVDRDGPEKARIDLRDLPLLRGAKKDPMTAMALEALSVKGIFIRKGSVTIELGLPGM